MKSQQLTSINVQKIISFTTELLSYEPQPTNGTMKVAFHSLVVLVQPLQFSVMISWLSMAKLNQDFCTAETHQR